MAASQLRDLSLTLLFLTILSAVRSDEDSIKSQLDWYIGVLGINLEYPPSPSDSYLLTLETDNEDLSELVFELDQSPQFYSSHLFSTEDLSKRSKCFFKGAIRNYVSTELSVVPEASKNKARIKFCNDYLSGLFALEGKMWSMHTESDGSMLIFDSSSFRRPNNASCPVTSKDPHVSDAFEKTNLFHDEMVLSRLKRDTLDQSRYVEISLFHDAAYFNKYNSDIRKVGFNS